MSGVCFMLASKIALADSLQDTNTGSPVMPERQIVYGLLSRLVP